MQSRGEEYQVQSRGKSLPGAVTWRVYQVQSHGVVYQVQSRDRCLLGAVTWLEFTRCSDMASLPGAVTRQEFTRYSHVARFIRCSHVAGVYQVQSHGRCLLGAVMWQEFTRCIHVARVYQVQSRCRSFTDAVT